METKFVDGLFVKRNEKAPEFVIANLSFNEKFLDWLKGNMNAKGYCNVDVVRSQKGTLYAKLNDWKPEDVRTLQQEEVEDEINVDKIPF